MAAGAGGAVDVADLETRLMSALDAVRTASSAAGGAAHERARCTAADADDEAQPCPTGLCGAQPEPVDVGVLEERLASTLDAIRAASSDAAARAAEEEAHQAALEVCARQRRRRAVREACEGPGVRALGGHAHACRYHPLTRPPAQYGCRQPRPSLTFLQAVRAAIRADSEEHGFSGLSLEEALRSNAQRRSTARQRTHQTRWEAEQAAAAPETGGHASRAERVAAESAAAFGGQSLEQAFAAGRSREEVRRAQQQEAERGRFADSVPVRATEAAAAEAAAVWGGGGLGEVLAAPAAQRAASEPQAHEGGGRAAAYAPVRRRTAAEQHADAWGDAPLAAAAPPRPARRRTAAASMNDFADGFEYEDPRFPQREARPFVGAVTDRVAQRVHGGAPTRAQAQHAAQYDGLEATLASRPERPPAEERARAAMRTARAAVQRLPLRVIKAGGEPVECAICLEEAGVGTELRALTCSHAFHQPCLTKWFAHGGMKCPLCRQACVAGA